MEYNGHLKAEVIIEIPIAHLDILYQLKRIIFNFRMIQKVFLNPNQ